MEWIAGALWPFLRIRIQLQLEEEEKKDLWEYDVAWELN